MSNFDLRKFLAEGKLHEEAALIEEAMDKPSNKQKLIDAGYSESDAEDFADEFEQGGVKIPQKVKDILSEKSSSKMKMSELKKKIREEILSEINSADGGFYDPTIDEATKDGDGKVPSKDEDTDIEDIKDKKEVDINVEEKPKAAGPSGDFLDQLEDLKDEADAMGDNKLERQVDNTITYFTRQHIAKDTNESIELEEDLNEAITADTIQKKYNEMFGKNPQTKFADVAKALNTTEQEIAAALFFAPMFEADELKEADKDYYGAAERDDAAHIAALEKDMEDDKRSAMNESLEILKMKKLAGLLTEGEYTKALLREGDFTTFNNVMAILNQLLEMGDEGKRVLAILERIPEWNELVRDNQDIDM